MSTKDYFCLPGISVQPILLLLIARGAVGLLVLPLHSTQYSNYALTVLALYLVHTLYIVLSFPSERVLAIKPYSSLPKFSFHLFTSHFPTSVLVHTLHLEDSSLACSLNDPRTKESLQHLFYPSMAKYKYEHDKPLEYICLHMYCLIKYTI